MSLYKASEKGDVSKVNIALSKKDVNVNEKYNKGLSGGWTPLTIACAKNHIEVVKILLKRKDLLLNQAMDDGATALYVASQKGHLEIVRLLLSKRLNVNKAKKDGCKPTHAAASFGRIEVLRLLLKQPNIDYTTKDNSGKTPQAWAQKKGHEEIVKLLARELEKQRQQMLRRHGKCAQGWEWIHKGNGLYNCAAGGHWAEFNGTKLVRQWGGEGAKTSSESNHVS